MADDIRALSDVLARDLKAATDELEDFDLAVGKRVHPRRRHRLARVPQPFQDRRVDALADVDPPVHHRADGSDDFSRRFLFGDIALRARAQDPLRVEPFRMHREHEYREPKVPRLQVLE